MYFSEVVQVFEQISEVSSRIEITKYLADLFAQATAQEIQILCNLSLGLLRPPYKGNQFNFAEKNLLNVMAKLLNKSEKDIKDQIKRLGDLGLVVVSLGDWKHTHNYTVQEVYADLCTLEEVSGKGSHEEKSEQILALLQKISPLEAKYIIRIILGILRLGFSDMTLIDALSWMEVGSKALRGRIEHAYNICVDIGLIASILKSQGIQALDTMNITVGIPIRPAAAERLPTAKAIFEKLGPCVAQPKLDGFRLQIHIDNLIKKPSIEFFSRNLLDMSKMFPDLVAAFESLSVEDLICEGEAIAYDPNTGFFLPFQETVKRKRKHGIEEAASEFPLQLFIFDLLYLNGKDYLNASHETRRTTLVHLFKGSKSTVIKIIDEVVINSDKELEQYFLENIDQGLEGLVVKKPDSIYQPGKRNFNWIKFKRHEEGTLEDTVDCVVLGYYAGSGKRATFGIGAFLVGVFNPDKDCFQTIAKIGTGLTDEEWREIKHRCDFLQVRDKPNNIECPKELYPDVWVAPKIVCSIRADEITLSPLHTAGKTENKLGYALRFPRFMGYRPDKSEEETTSVQELHGLFEEQFKK